MVPNQQYWFEKPVFMQGEQPALPKRKINMELETDYRGMLIETGPLAFMQNQSTPWSYYTYEYVAVGYLELVAQTPWDVVNVNPNTTNQPKSIVLPHHLASQVSFEPNLPVVGLKIVKALLQMDIDNSRGYRQSPTKTMEEVLHPFIKDTALPQANRMNPVSHIDYMRNDPWFQQTFNMVFDSLLPYLQPIRNVMRSNPYQIAQVEFSDTYQMFVNQLGDYRIHEYNNITSDPQYAAWQRARANGEWDRYLSTHEEIEANNSAKAVITNPYQ